MAYSHQLDGFNAYMSDLDASEDKSKEAPKFVRMSDVAAPSFLEMDFDQEAFEREQEEARKKTFSSKKRASTKSSTRAKKRSQRVDEQNGSDPDYDDTQSSKKKRKPNTKSSSRKKGRPAATGVSPCEDYTPGEPTCRLKETYRRPDGNYQCNVVLEHDRKGGKRGQICRHVADRPADMLRHHRARGHQKPQYKCMAYGCGKSYTRDDALKRHVEHVDEAHRESHRENGGIVVD